MSVQCEVCTFCGNAAHAGWKAEVIFRGETLIDPSNGPLFACASCVFERGGSSLAQGANRFVSEVEWRHAALASALGFHPDDCNGTREAHAWEFVTVKGRPMKECRRCELVIDAPKDAVRR